MQKYFRENGVENVQGSHNLTPGGDTWERQPRFTQPNILNNFQGYNWLTAMNETNSGIIDMPTKLLFELKM
jgi:hypothetical protein